MGTDLELIKEIEREVGRRLPRAHVGGKLPMNPTVAPPRGKRPLRRIHTFEEMCNGPAFGCFLDDKDNVVGLALDSCGLTSVPEAVFHLKNLRILNLAANNLTTFPSRITELPRLSRLQLLANKISELPLSILETGPEIGMAVDSAICMALNPLQSPPREIVEHGTAAIRAYFQSLATEALPLNEVRVLLVGDGGAGKTSLVKRLLGKEFDRVEPQTHGINIDQWTMSADGKNVKINFWDFGGQEIMHATHQFFLSERSVYVLVLDGRKEEDAEYWLKHIESFGGDSPILVVLNKMDENPGFDINRRFLQGKYKGICGFYPMSCDKGTGVMEFKDGLASALGRVRMMGTTWPAAWFRVKERLVQMKDPFITYENYCVLCGSEKIEDETSQKTLVQFLHDLGVIVHFSDFHLQHTHVLDPRWLTGAVYRIINSQELAAGKGVLRLDSLRTILPSIGDGQTYPADKHAYIIDLMRKFELCYQMDEETILVPDLLEVQEPEIPFEYSSAITIHIEYDFLPKSIIPRFIVRKHRDIKDNLRWRTGVVLHDETYGATAVVRADEGAKRISIYVAGDHPRDYMTVIRSTFLEINKSFEKLKFTEKIPLPDDPEIATGYEHLLWLEKEGKSECYPEGAKHPYKVQALLGTITIEAKRSEKEIAELLKKVIADSDTEETALQKANNVITLQPNIAGMGINLNELIKRFWRKPKRG